MLSPHGKSEADNKRKRAEIFSRYNREFVSYGEFNTWICIDYYWNYLSSWINVLKTRSFSNVHSLHGRGKNIIYVSKMHVGYTVQLKAPFWLDVNAECIMKTESKQHWNKSDYVMKVAFVTIATVGSTVNVAFPFYDVNDQQYPVMQTIRLFFCQILPFWSVIYVIHGIHNWLWWLAFFCFVFSTIQLKLNRCIF